MEIRRLATRRHLPRHVKHHILVGDGSLEGGRVMEVASDLPYRQIVCGGWGADQGRHRMTGLAQRVAQMMTDEPRGTSDECSQGSTGAEVSKIIGCRTNLQTAADVDDQPDVTGAHHAGVDGACKAVGERR